jgi:hypothetical protein
MGWSAVLAAAVVGCSSGAAKPPPQVSSAPPAATESHVGCPLGVANAKVTVSDTAQGVELVFTAEDRVAELRMRVRDAGEQHGTGAKAGAGHEGRHATGGEHGLQPMSLPPMRTEVEEVERGARLRLLPIDPADVDKLRSRVRERAAKMSASRCD